MRKYPPRASSFLREGKGIFESVHPCGIGMDLSSTRVIPLGVGVEVSSKGSSLWSGAQVFPKRGHPSEVAVEVSSQEVILELADVNPI